MCVGGEAGNEVEETLRFEVLQKRKLISQTEMKTTERGDLERGAIRSVSWNTICLSCPTDLQIEMSSSWIRV